MSHKKVPRPKRKPGVVKMKLTTKPKVSISDLVRLFVIGDTDNKQVKKNASRYSMNNNNNNGATNARENLSECREELSRVKEELMTAKLNLQRLENNKSSNNNSSVRSYNRSGSKKSYNRSGSKKSYNRSKPYSLKSYGSMYN